ncbi:hypothetical protein Taro_037199 [Colocasia esculenta]|uniref:Uncharacterized protein n=1 Tax=Colocasia esculenta TaxID=4460 RepID=A0A843WP01_COLES|nr:hypothetical protein [Colocasia esculenta]
MRIRRRRDFVS